MNRSRQMFYDSVAWRRIRVVVLERDGRLCQIRGRRCEVAANEVDHVIRPEDGGGWYSAENLRAACGTCNRGRGGKVGAARTNAKYAARVRPSREW